MKERPRLYTSLRSPYSWFAHSRLLAADFTLQEFDVIPVFPPSAAAVAAIGGGKTKGAYQKADVQRIAAAYGLSLTNSVPPDTDWWRPHAVYLWARDRDHERGTAFLTAAFRRRFVDGQDLGSSEVLRELADEIGIDPQEAQVAADAPAWRETIQSGFTQMRADHAWGVPTIAFEGELFFGNDRLDWFRRALAASRREPVPDLTEDPWARVF